jgi:hypothetical protein
MCARKRRAGSWRWRVAVAVVISVVLFQLNPAKAVAMDFALKAGRFQPAKSDLRKVTSGSWFATALEVPVGQLGAGKLSLEVAWLKERRSPDPGLLIESDIVPVTLNYTLGRGLFQWGTGAGLYYVRIVESAPPPIPASPNFAVEDVSGDFPGTQRVAGGHIFVRYGAGALFAELLFQMVNAKVEPSFRQGVLKNQNGLIFSVGYWFGK